MAATEDGVESSKTIKQSAKPKTCRYRATSKCAVWATVRANCMFPERRLFASRPTLIANGARCWKSLDKPRRLTLNVSAAARSVVPPARAQPLRPAT